MHIELPHLDDFALVGLQNHLNDLAVEGTRRRHNVKTVFEVDDQVKLLGGEVFVEKVHAVLQPL